MSKIVFSEGVADRATVRAEVKKFVGKIPTLEKERGSELLVSQDGKSKGYYLRCAISAKVSVGVLDLDARLIPESTDSFRANRELLLDHNTYKRMRADAEAGREFNDIIVEYNTSYAPEKPLKVWGGQHRSKAIQESFSAARVNRYHGFRVYFSLSKEQRTELALISNTNINISNDLFDRQLEETLVGPQLRKWCQRAGLLSPDEDFPSQGSLAERITTKLARTFIVNFHKGKGRGKELSKDSSLDMSVYEPYICESGATLDEEYENIVKTEGIQLWTETALLKTGEAFAVLHHAQYKAVRSGKGMKNIKGFRNKALTDSVLAAWSYVAGLLQSEPGRLATHLSLPKLAKGSRDPLNAAEMSQFKHGEDPPTYRGLGTRSAIKDRQRMAQVFLARSQGPELAFDKQLLNRAVSQVVGLKALKKGYTG